MRTFLEITQPIIILVLIIWTVIIIKYLFNRSKYIKSDYYKTTGTSFNKVYFNKGAHGEYLSSKYLERLDGYKKFLYNVYLNKTDKENETTEIDVIMLHTSGIYVLESKNYSGWIYGREQDKNWKQTLENKQKNSFYNPIKQNKTHIKYLLQTLEELGDFNSYIKSIIVFSERCTLKKIEITSENVRVIKRDDILPCCRKLAKESTDQLTQEQIDSIYSLLTAHCNVSDEVKQQHIEDIKKRISK